MVFQVYSGCQVNGVAICCASTKADCVETNKTAYRKNFLQQLQAKKAKLKHYQLLLLFLFFFFFVSSLEQLTRLSFIKKKKL